jgi:hypothetical protein
LYGCSTIIHVLPRRWRVGRLEAAVFQGFSITLPQENKKVSLSNFGPK